MIAPLIADELRAIEQRADCATTGENGWYVDETCNGNEYAIRCHVRGESDEEPSEIVIALIGPHSNLSEDCADFQDAEFIAHAREDVPRLIATVKALRLLLHGVGWNDAAIDMALPAISMKAVTR